MMVLVFKTNIRSAADLKKVGTLLNGDGRIRCWNVDREDIDCVLRIEAIDIRFEEVIDMVLDGGFKCSELND